LLDGLGLLADGRRWGAARRAIAAARQRRVPLIHHNTNKNTKEKTHYSDEEELEDCRRPLRAFCANQHMCRRRQCSCARGDLKQF